jgi:outer membrane protein OmpA-like peptidoglycan-associated protein
MVSRTRKPNRLFIICILLLLFVISGTHSNAQVTFAGYRTSNYTGVNGVFYNPANIADSRFRWDFNLAGVNVGAGNNNMAYKIKDITDAIKNKSDSLLNRLAPKTLSGIAFGDVLGPSLMFNLNAHTSFALTTRARAMVNITDLDGKLIQTISNPVVDPSFPYTIGSNKDQRLSINGWTEYGVSMGRIISNKGNHFFKVGITLKYLAGVGNNYVDVNNISGTVNHDAGNNFYMSSTGTVSLGIGGLDYSNINNANYHSFTGKGFGGDIGAVYEYRPDDYADRPSWQNKYKYKIGLAILDLGRLNYTANGNLSGAYALKATGNGPNDLLYLDNLQGKSIPDLKAFMDTSRFFNKTGAGALGSGKYAVGLPTSLQLNADAQIIDNFYVDLAVQIAFSSATKYQNPNYQQNITVTPRYDGKILGAFLPVNYSSLTGFNAGFALRAGPFYAGSGSIITSMLGATKQLDAYAGVHIGILHKKKKEKKQASPVVEKHTEIIPAKPVFIDTDGDGITDSLDKCPTIAGTAKYNGCPTPDSDGDGINDEEDKCPNQPGLAKYQGCPIPDTDGDGVNDEEDKCPNIAGPVSNKGCPIPDTDGDGLNDQDDKCPTLAGPPANNGCPVVQQEVVKKINYAAKSILFQTGKASLLAASYSQLNNVADILKQDPNVKLNIDGHTDNIGKPEANLLLSQKRAEAVRDYLIKKGVAAARLHAKGFGDTMPLVENKTASNRNKNRRVELKLNYE